MIIAELEYVAELRTQLAHLQSGVTIITDAPTDNHGKGQAFSPTDLLSSSLAACMFTLMGITANNHGFEFTGGKAVIEKEMLSNPRRVGAVRIKATLKNTYSERQKLLLETAARNCPVAKSLNTEVEQDIVFSYE